ncbi:MAG: hypothetical protein KDC45_11720 [Bacteroidetes bacterium]|nr:hypothetical protein [Bacteroidota bacterium]
MRLLLTVIILFTFVTSAFAQIGSPAAGTDRYGSFYTFSAKTTTFPEFYTFQNMQFFTGTGERSGSKPSVKDFGLQFGAQMGLFGGADIVLISNFIQTPNRAPSIPSNEVVTLVKSVDVPDEFYANMRLLPFSFSEDKATVALMLTGRWHANGFANAPFQPYSAGKAEAGIGLVGSYFSDPLFPETGWAMHANVQYWNHLDNGAYLGYIDEKKVRALPGGNVIADTAISTSNTSSFKFSIGGSYPIAVASRYMYIVGDLYGTFFLNKPSIAAYSRQNYSYLALGVKYQLFDWLGVHAGGEYLVLKGTDKTLTNGVALGIEDLTISKADFPTWRMFMGVSFPINPRAQYRVYKAGSEIVQEQSVIRKKEVEGILYSEQEIQKRSQNFVPLKDMRRDYKTIIGSYVTILQAKDKKVDESISDTGNE